MTECKHGLELAVCDICTPKKKPLVAPPPRAARATTPRVTKSKTADRSSTRLHVVLTIEDFAEALAEGEVVDPIYFHGPEELAWAEKRRSAKVREQVVLVTTYGFVQDTTGQSVDVLPIHAVKLVAVANTAALERVRDLIDLTDYTPKLVIHPPWFKA